MNKIITTLIGTSLLAGALYAGQHTSKGNNTHSQCNNTVKSDKSICSVSEAKVSTKSAIDLFQESLAQNDPFGGG